MIGAFLGSSRVGMQSLACVGCVAFQVLVNKGYSAVTVVEQLFLE